MLVNNVCPGFTTTDGLMGLAYSMAARKGVRPQEVQEEWASPTLLKRVGKPEELANVVVFLASEGAS